MFRVVVTAILMAVVLSACVHTPKKGGGGGGPRPGGAGPAACGPGNPRGNPAGKPGPQGPSLDDGLILDDRFQRNLAAEAPPIPEIRSGNGLPTGPDFGPVPFQAFGGFNNTFGLPLGSVVSPVGEVPPPQALFSPANPGNGLGQGVPFQGPPPPQAGSGNMGDAPIPKAREIATHSTH